VDEENPYFTPVPGSGKRRLLWAQEPVFEGRAFLLFSHSEAGYPHTLAASSSLAWPHSVPYCFLIVYLRTCIHSLRPPHSLGHPGSLACFLIMYQCTCIHSPRPPPLPGH
jgi:hypothetical protein